MITIEQSLERFYTRLLAGMEPRPSMWTRIRMVFNRLRGKKANPYQRFDDRILGALAKTLPTDSGFLFSTPKQPWTVTKW